MTPRLKPWASTTTRPILKFFGYILKRRPFFFGGIAISSFARSLPQIPALCALVLLAICAHAQSELASPALERRAESILRQMTLEEKIGQLVQYSAGVPTGPGTGRADYREQIVKGQIGSLSEPDRRGETNTLQRWPWSARG